MTCDSQKFVFQTKKLEKQCCDLAISKTQQLAQDKTNILVHVTSRRICEEAFNSFKREIEIAFHSNDYSNLISLTLKSRENLFFGDLKNRVISILRGQLLQETEQNRALVDQCIAKPL